MSTHVGSLIHTFKTLTLGEKKNERYRDKGSENVLEFETYNSNQDLVKS